MGILKNCKISDKPTSDDSTGSCKQIDDNTTVEDIPSIFQADPNGNECRSYYYQFLYSKGYLVDDEKTKEQYIEAYDEFLNMPVVEDTNPEDINLTIEPEEAIPVEKSSETKGGTRRRRRRRHRKKSRRHKRSLRHP